MKKNIFYVVDSEDKIKAKVFKQVKKKVRKYRKGITLNITQKPIKSLNINDWNIIDYNCLDELRDLSVSRNLDKNASFFLLNTPVANRLSLLDNQEYKRLGIVGFSSRIATQIFCNNTDIHNTYKLWTRAFVGLTNILEQMNDYEEIIEYKDGEVFAKKFNKQTKSVLNSGYYLRKSLCGEVYSNVDVIVDRYLDILLSYFETLESKENLLSP
ncbi:hypothetical protein [uncultured Microscilla sp.]|uniref:hypothetical protein n=1 Tax=uncultured Microscilla sp. TaxID=432653 RepID=UPI00260CAF76|nr:hypothetical protein [uncultured Microscilla sp.]